MTLRKCKAGFGNREKVRVDNIKPDFQTPFMGPYILTAAIILAAAMLGAAYLFSKSAKIPDDVAKRAVETAKVVTDGVTELGTSTIKATENLLQPISNAVGKVGESLAERLRVKQIELTELRQKVLSLTQEVESLKSRRVSIDQTKSILQLALLEAGFTHYNYKKMVVKEIPSKISRDEQIEYLGIIRATYKQRLGVDLEKLRFQQISDCEIAVYGLGQAEVVGTREIHVEPLHTELRRHLASSKLMGSVHEIIDGDPERMANGKEREQNAEIHREINEDRTTKEIDDAIGKLALSFLQMCFSPAKYQVVRVESPLERPKTFQEIGTDLNRRIDDLNEDRTRSLMVAISECGRIEREVAQLIDSNPAELKAEVFRASQNPAS